jgi:hypothetical protein
MRLSRSAVWIVLAVSLVPIEAAAQSSGRVAVGVSLSPKRAPDETTQGGTGIGFLWRLGHGREGWGWKYGLNWYSADIDQTIAGRHHEFGHLRIRPIMAGYGYSHIIGPAKISANLLGGYAFNSFSMKPTFNDLYRSMRGAASVDARVSNTFVIKPEVSTWIDLSPKIGLNVSAGYMRARPSVTVTSTLGEDRRRIRADMFMFKVGAVYSIF